MDYTILDISTAPIDRAAEFLDEPSAPSNYKDPEKIAAYIADAKQKAVDKAALDVDLGWITGIGLSLNGTAPIHFLCHDETEERDALAELARLIAGPTHRPILIGFNALEFDWPFLSRRARYLGVNLDINVDRYKSPHIDLLERLTYHGKLTMRSLAFYVKRMGWTDLSKPLTGSEESRVPVTGKWDELRQSIEHDVEATRRLAEWLGVFAEREALA